MKKLFLLLVINISLFSFCLGQGTVRGKITDENGEPAIAATVILKSNRTIATSTNFDGNYTLKLPDSSAQVLVVSYMGYKTIEEPVRVANGKVVIKNFDVKPEAKEMKEVVVVGKAAKAKEYYMEKVKMNSVTTLDYISAETMKKTGDANVTAAVARVPGVTTSSDGFITVRGIGDRYVKTTINGFRIPTLDPFTNNIKLDLIPTSLVDNVILTKTASAELPGDWAGAYMSVETKEYPEKFTLNIETSVGYNNQVTFKDILSSQVSPTDRLGYDNGFRDYDHKNFVPVNKDPNPYEEFVALGLGPYYNNMGVNSSWELLSSVDAKENYFKLGLVQLGLLPPAMFNDADAVNAATAAYNRGPHKNQAFNTINAPAVSSAEKFPNNWNTITRKAPLDFSQGFTVGNQIDLFGKPFGFITGFRYGSSVISDLHASQNNLFPNAVDFNYTHGKLQTSEVSNGWSALFNVAYKLNPNNSVSFLFMPNLKGVNRARNLVADDPGIFKYTLTKSQSYESRKQLIYQFKSEHYLPGPKLKTELNVSYTGAKSTVPDYKELTLFSNDSIEYWMDIVESRTGRNYRYLKEEMLDSRIAMELPLGNKNTLTRKLKFGGAYQRGDREYMQYNYIVRFKGAGNLLVPYNNIDSLFPPGTWGISNDNNIAEIKRYYDLLDIPSNHSFGYSRTMAGYVMLDYALVPALRFSAGLRVEQAKIVTDVFLYDSLGYKAGDPRRKSGREPFFIDPGKLDELSYLPSVTLVYRLKKDDTAPINIRLNYSQAVARPSIRELSDVAVYDYEFQDEVMGNADLKMVRIYNYDARVESYFRSGDNISLSLFYKQFKDHIELIRSIAYTWRNVDNSHVAGIELEGKKILTKNFSISANMALIRSESRVVIGRLEVNGKKVFIPTDTLTRTMFGQAPYVINGIFSYKSDSIGFSAAISYNIQGEKLVIGSVGLNPDVFELPRHSLDVRLSKSLGKYFGVNLTVRNVLNAAVTRSYLFEDRDKIDFDSFSYGTNYVLGISYKL